MKIWNGSGAGRNPLKSGQGFLHDISSIDFDAERFCRRNPLKSGQGFLLEIFEKEISQNNIYLGRNPLKSGQGFLQHPSFFTDYRKLNTPFAGTSLFLCFLFPYLTYLLP